MSTTKAFRGFIPARKKGGGYNNEAVTDMITLTSTGQAQSPSNNIFTGDRPRQRFSVWFGCRCWYESDILLKVCCRGPERFVVSCSTSKI